MDDADYASERTDTEVQRYLAMVAKAIKTQKSKLIVTGFCYNCSDTAPPGRTFCSKDCADDYRKMEEARKRNGK